MNKQELKTTVIALIVMTTLFAGASLSFAAENPVTPVTIEDFQVEDPAILPGNPFYKLKGFFKNLFEDNAEEILNRKAAELLKVEEVAGVNSKMFGKALNAYEETLEDVDEIEEETTKLHLRLVNQFLEKTTKKSYLKQLEAFKSVLEN